MPGGRGRGRGVAAPLGRPVAEPVCRRTVGRMATALLAGRQEVLPDIPARVPVPGDDGTGAAARPQGFRGVRVSAGQCAQSSRFAVSSAVPARRVLRRRTILRARPGKVTVAQQTTHIIITIIIVIQYLIARSKV